MITIILENETNVEVERVEAVDNRQYLLSQNDCLKYPILCEISDCDYEIILSKDTPQLISELESLKSNLVAEQQTHVDEIIRLAKICRDNIGYTLIFTPFAKLIR